MSIQFSIDQIYLAYRKAKYYAFRDRNAAFGFAFAEFERDLHGNLSRLYSWIGARSEPSEGLLAEVVGGWGAIPRASGHVPDSTERHFYTSDPFEARPLASRDVEFRPIALPTPLGMTFSALWCMTAGAKYDAALAGRYVFGSRIHRQRSRKHDEAGPPSDSLHLFEYWPRRYGAWQRRGLAAIRAALQEKRDVLALTMDLRRFYHRIDPSFLLDPDYLNLEAAPRIELSAGERWLTEQYIRASSQWRRMVGEQGGLSEDDCVVGVPVGWTASAVVANVALRELDREILQRLSPIYYGRYVDDLFLVLEPHRKFSSDEDVSRWLDTRIPCFTATPAQGSVDAIKVSLAGLGASNLEFAAKKQKVFCLSGESGLDLLKPIREAIRRRSSEHRALPNLPDEDGRMASAALLVAADASVEADSLRKAEGVSLRRLGFSLLLSKAWMYHKLLSPKVWTRRRRAFLEMARRHLLTPRGFLDLAGYIRNVFTLGSATGEWDELYRFLDDLVRVRASLLAVLAGTQVALFERAWAGLGEHLIEAVAQGAKEELSSQADVVWRRVFALFRPSSPAMDMGSSSENLRRVDWSATGHMENWLEETPRMQPVRPQTLSPSTAVQDSAYPTFSRYMGVLQQISAARGLSMPTMPAAFPTRLPSVTALTRLVLASPGLSMREVMWGVKGLYLQSEFPSVSSGAQRDGDATWPSRRVVPFESEVPGRARIVVVSMSVADDAWEYAARDRLWESAERLEGVSKLLNRVLEDVAEWRRGAGVQKVPPVYVLLPELSMPRAWANTFLERLAHGGVSVVGGLEYGFEDGRPVNEAFVSLVSGLLPGGPALYVQRKRHPAWHEAELLRTAIGRELLVTQEPLPVYVHGDFCFSVAICSDFTDAKGRMALQGSVDALFVPEWNKDTGSFASLVETSVLDLHAFVAQANNRRFGDSRVRGPLKNEWERDLVQLKGGRDDFYAVADVDFHALREFQSHAEPPTASPRFKPFPIGFKLDPRRERPSRGARARGSKG